MKVSSYYAMIRKVKRYMYILWLLFIWFVCRHILKNLMHFLVKKFMMFSKRMFFPKLRWILLWKRGQITMIDFWKERFVNFRWRWWWSLLPGLRTFDPLIGPPSTWAEIPNLFLIFSKNTNKNQNHPPDKVPDFLWLES